jgi:hypothetical protein
MPLDIGETSSAELPVIPHEEQPPVITPSRAKQQHEGNAAPDQGKPQSAKPQVAKTRRTHRARPAAKQANVQFGLFESLFDGGDGPVAATQPTAAPNQSTFIAQ